MRCRATDDPDTAAGLDVLGAAVARRLQGAVRTIGTPQALTRGVALADLDASRGCLLEAGGQIDDALDAGARPMLLAGDGAISLATLPTIARRRPDALVLWLDAHACFHDVDAGAPLERTALAGACGDWDSGWPDQLAAASLVLCGTRAIDDPERRRLEGRSVRVIGTTLETLVHLQHALDGRPTYVHLDVDVLDPEEVPVADPVGGGLAPEKLLDLLDAVADSCEVVGVEVCGFTATRDVGRTRDLAEIVASAIDPLLP
jgi:arginase family enzyme